MALISLQKCTEYNNKILKDKIITGLRQINFDLIGLKDKRVCLKPNLLMPLNPERAVTTHPELFRAVAEIVHDYTHNIVLIELPNFFPLKSTIKKTSRRYCERLGDRSCGHKRYRDAAFSACASL